MRGRLFSHLRCTALVVTMLMFVGLAEAQVSFYRTAYSGVSPIVQGDFNRDGRPDFINVQSSPEGAPLMTVFLNVGAGKFAPHSQFVVGNPDYSFHADTADFNGDGILDVVVAHEFEQQFHLWFGNGDGTFRAGPSTNTNGSAYVFRLGDVDEDGDIDLLFASNFDGSSSGGDMMLNNGDGTFTEGTNYSFNESEGGPLFRNFDLFDFNGDGHLDVIVRTTDNRLTVYCGTGAANIFWCRSNTVVGGVGDMAVGSFNRDSKLDVAFRIQSCQGASCAAKVYVYLNDGSGAFALRSVATAGVGEGEIEAGDLTGDGFQDLVVTSQDAQDGSAVKQQYLRNHGDAIFDAPVTFATERGFANPLLRDVNRDGRHDLYGASFPGVTHVLLNTNAAVICAPPGSATLNAKFCGLNNEANVARTFTVNAAGNSAAGVVRMELWVDGRKSYDSWNDQLRRSITVSAGRHRVTAIAVDRFGKTASRSVFVQAN